MNHFQTSLSFVLIFSGCQFVEKNSSASIPVQAIKAEIPSRWPPSTGKEFPDIELVDSGGEIHKLSEFRGKPILLEFVGMTCPACQSWSGGSFENTDPQKNIKGVETYVSEYGRGLKLSDPRVWFIQVLLYNMSMESPTSADVARWKKRYEQGRGENYLVFAPKNDLRGQASYDLIPGFQLIDSKLVVQKDATGHSPKDNLYSDLLPLFASLAIPGGN